MNELVRSQKNIIVENHAVVVAKAIHLEMKHPVWDLIQA